MPFKRGDVSFVFIHNPKTGGTSIAETLGLPKGHTPRFMVDTDKFTFAFVRNPYNWLGSYYNYVMQHQWHYDHHLKDFGDFVRNYCDRVKTEVFAEGQFYYCTQATWVKGCDFIGRFEDMGNDWRRLLYRLKLPYKDLPILNKSKGEKCYLHLYDKETLTLVNRTFKDDFKYGYDKRRQP